MAIQSFHALAVARKNGSVPPTNTARPDVTGTEEVGETLTCTAGTWTGSPTITYQWRRDNVNISGATASTYLIDEDDQGTLLSCYVTGTNAGGSLTVRATTDHPTIFVIDGDSLTSADSWPELLQTALGAGWDVQNYAVSAQNIDDMAADSTAQIDPQADPGSSLYLGWEFINQAAASTGQEVYDKLDALNDGRETAGFIVLRATDFHIDSDCQFAGDLVRTNFPNAIELDRSDLRADSNTVDDIHLTGAGEAIVAEVVEDYLVANGYIGYTGGIPIPAAPSNDDLRTFSSAGYVYKLVGDLPYPPVTTPSLYLHISGGTGWDVGTHLITGGIENFSTVDGEKDLYGISPDQAAGGLSGGIYTIDNTP